MKLERGINLGGYLSQCVHNTEHYDAFIQEEDIRKIASMGFDHVRLAIDYEVLEDEYGRTREEGFAYVTRVVEWPMDPPALAVIMVILKGSEPIAITSRPYQPDK